MRIFNEWSCRFSWTRCAFLNDCSCGFNIALIQAVFAPQCVALIYKVIEEITWFLMIILQSLSDLSFEDKCRQTFTNTYLNTLQKHPFFAVLTFMVKSEKKSLSATFDAKVSIENQQPRNFFLKIIKMKSDNCKSICLKTVR